MNQILIIFIVIVIVCLLLGIIGLLVEEDEVPEKIWHVYNGSNPITKTLVDKHNDLFFTTPTPTSCDEYNRFVLNYVSNIFQAVHGWSDNDVMSAMHEFDSVLYKRNFATGAKRMEFINSKKNMKKYTPECYPYADFENNFLFGPESKLMKALGCECVENICGIIENNEDSGTRIPVWMDGVVNGLYTQPKDNGFEYDEILTKVAKIVYLPSDSLIPITCASFLTDNLMLINYAIYLHEQASESTREQASFELPDCDPTMANQAIEPVSCVDQELTAKLNNLFAIALSKAPDGYDNSFSDFYENHETGCESY